MRRDICWRSAPWIVLTIVSLSNDLLAQCDDERLEPSGAVVEGKTVGEWTAVFWQWLARIPADETHPLLAGDGTQCAREQDEPVFLISGSLFQLVINGQPFPWSGCVVPCGKPLLVPLTWALMWAPGDCEPGSMQDCAALAKGLVDSVTIVEVTLDGTPLPCPAEHRVVSPVFDFQLPAPPAANVFNLEEPLLRQGVADGYWLLLKPLPPGNHTVLVRTLQEGLEEEFPILYELTVAPCDSASFRRGDTDGNQAVNLTDAVYTLSHLFQGGDELPCDDAADANDSGRVDLSDAIHTLNHLFRGGPAPPAPGPDECGTDPTEEDGMGCEKGC